MNWFFFSNPFRFSLKHSLFRENGDVASVSTGMFIPCLGVHVLSPQWWKTDSMSKNNDYQPLSQAEPTIQVGDFAGRSFPPTTNPKAPRCASRQNITRRTVTEAVVCVFFLSFQRSILSLLRIVMRNGVSISRCMTCDFLCLFQLCYWRSALFCVLSWFVSLVRWQRWRSTTL